MTHRKLSVSILLLSIIISKSQTITKVGHVNDTNGFGFTTAIYDSTLVVGNTGTGADEAFVYDLDTTSSKWKLTQILTVNDTNDGYDLNLGVRCVDIFKNIIALAANDD